MYQKSNTKTGLLIADIKSKLNNAIINDDWDIDNIYEEHDYVTPATFDCIIYFITGRVCRQLLTFITCPLCIEALTTNSEVPHRKAELSDVLFESFVHPNVGLYKFIKHLEHVFSKHRHQLDVTEAVLSDIIESNTLGFPCEEHKIDIISYIVHYYLQIRLSTYCRQLNDTKKNYERIKKLSKHYKT